MESRNWRNHVLFSLGQVLRIKWPVYINGFMPDKPGNPAKKRIMLKMALPNGIKTKLIGEKSIQKTGPPGITFFLVFSRFQRRNWWWKLSAGNAWLGRKQEKNVLDLSRYPMVKWRAPGGIRGGRNLLLKCGCRVQCLCWSRRLFSCHNPTKNATLFTAYHTNRCWAYRKDLQHPWTRANIPHTSREASGGNNLWNLWLWERTGCFPLAMAVALVRKSAHNAYQLRLPAVP